MSIISKKPILRPADGGRRIIISYSNNGDAMRDLADAAEAAMAQVKFTCNGRSYTARRDDIRAFEIDDEHGEFVARVSRQGAGR
jgi:hypothetical protein